MPNITFKTEDFVSEMVSGVKQPKLFSLADTFIEAVEEDKINTIIAYKAVCNIAKDNDIYSEDLIKCIKSKNMNVWYLIKISKDLQYFQDIIDGILSIRKIL